MFFMLVIMKTKKVSPAIQENIEKGRISIKI